MTESPIDYTTAQCGCQCHDCKGAVDAVFGDSFTAHCNRCQRLAVALHDLGHYIRAFVIMVARRREVAELVDTLAAYKQSHMPHQLSQRYDAALRRIAALAAMTER